MKPVILICALTALFIMTLVECMVLSNRRESGVDLTKESVQPTLVRVRRNGLTYNKCANGYKRIPGQLCVPCSQFEKFSGAC